ncbi:MAG: hypothetical protein ABGW99_08500 [Zunongwangia sp.]|uniref:hypothetical protein n=1 Tax=Zunongwangia sp. TaxID=1965325 RepID=UPI0032429E21
MLQHYKNADHPFSLIITVTEEINNETDHSLYDEMLVSNELTIIPEAEVMGDADLEAEN